MFRPETDWLARWATYTPDRTVLRDHARDVTWSYAEADRRAAALAVSLRDVHGVGAGDRIALYSRNRAEMFFLFFAAVKLGAILAPLNFRLTPRELDGLIVDCEPSLLVHEASFANEVSRLTAIPGRCRLATIEDVEPFLFGEVSDPGPRTYRALADDIVMILYTSGTTGRPKGVTITHHMLLWNSINTGLRLDLTSADHTQSYAPLFHTGGWNVLFTPFLHHGASHTVLPGFDADLVLELIERERSTLLFGVPTMLQMMADSPRFADADLSSLRYAVVGGAPMPLPLIETWHGRGVFVRQGYGLTEVGPNCFSLHQDDAARKRGSIGFPNFYLDARIVDETGEDVTDETPGELWLRSPVVTPGYWRKPEETRAAITNGWFHTGDVVKRDTEGFFHVVDRKKNMFISGGENVYPAEIERVLDQHPDVVESAVIGVPDARWGEAGLAFLVTRRDLGEASLRTHCEASLARYKIPREYRFVAELPRNEAGKIDRTALAQNADPGQERNR